MTQAFKVEVSAIRTFIATIWKSYCSTRESRTALLLDSSAMASGETDDTKQI